MPLSLSSISDLITEANLRLSRRLGSELEPDAGSLDNVAEDALRDFSSYRPRRVQESLSGNGTATEFTVAAWLQNFSSVISVEYPTGSWPLEILPADEYEYDEAAAKLRFIRATPATGTSNIKVTHTATWTSSTVSSVSQADISALVLLTCAHLCRHYQAIHAHTVDGEINAEPVASGSDRSERWAALYDSYRGQALSLLGVAAQSGQPVATPYSAWADRDPPGLFGGAIWRTRRER